MSTTTTFDESQFRRATDGKFATKPVVEAAAGMGALTSPAAAPAVDIGSRPAPVDMSDLAPNGVGPASQVRTASCVETRHPNGRTTRTYADRTETSDAQGRLDSVDDVPSRVFVSGVRAGAREWHKAGELHRENGPAIERTGGGEAWYLDGKLHREGGPASTDRHGNTWWSRHGELHREDGPAVDNRQGFGFRQWRRNDELIAHVDDTDVTLPEGARVGDATGFVGPQLPDQD
ncbi:hypothetical protein ACFWGN_15085 [Oerskovia sp. NPDC060338]|uniref:hypothetical protein n=1 Tax=Oerskovia sp. NPDC060338 TaxID=3347100 RepID=UPI003651DC8F